MKYYFALAVTYALTAYGILSLIRLPFLIRKLQNPQGE